MTILKKKYCFKIVLYKLKLPSGKLIFHLLDDYFVFEQ